MQKDCIKWVRACIQCQREKIFRHTQSEFQKFKVPEGRFRHVHIDIVGPLPLVKDNKYCLTCIDRYTCWTEVILLADMTAVTVAKAFYNNWISRFGSFEKITTDQGRQFESDLFISFTNVLSIRRTRTSSYHPQCNGKIKRSHRTLKQSIKAHEHTDWVSILPKIMLDFRCALKGSDEVTTVEMLYGQPLRLPGEFLSSDNREEPLTPTFVTHLKNKMKLITSVPTKHNERKKPFVSADLKVASHVFIGHDAIKKPLQMSYDGPYKVLNRTDK